MSPKNLNGELKAIEKSLKRTTSSDCPYDISEEVAKRFILLRQRADITTKIILQAEMDLLQEKFFDEIGQLDGFDVISEIFKPEDPSRRIFNYFILSLVSKKNIEQNFLKKFKKLEGRKESLRKRFQEISFREEFYFNKLTKQIVERYRKTLKPYEFRILNLIFDFQNDLRFFNWQIVNKDPQVEFLFNIFNLLQIKQNLLENDVQYFDDLQKVLSNANKFDGSSYSDFNGFLFELLYIANRVNILTRRIKGLEQELFKDGLQIVIKKLKKKDSMNETRLVTKYLREIQNLNTVINRFKKIKNIGLLEDINKKQKDISLNLINLIEQNIKPKEVTNKSQLKEEFKNEFHLVGFIIRLFRKIFWLLKRKRTMTDITVIKRLLSEVIRREKVKVMVLMGIVFINAVVGIFFPLVLGDLVSYLTTGTATVSEVYRYGYLFLLVAILSLVFSIISNWIVQYLGNRVMFDMREKMYHNLQKLSFDYYNFQPAGKIISYITNDVETIQELISSGLLTIFVDVFRLVGSIFFMVIIRWELTVIAFSIIPFILIGAFSIFKKARKFFVISRRKIAGVTMHLQESIAGMRTIKSFAVEEKDYSTFKRATEEELEINLKSAKLFSALPGLMTLVISGGLGILILTGGWFYIQGVLQFTALTFDPGDLIKFILFIFQFFQPIITLMQFVTNIQNSMAAGERIINLIDIETTVKEKPNAIGLESDEFKDINRDNVIIRFENVNFEYEKGLPILNNISIKTTPGERLALVGYTGAGKTTFTKLLSRFWDVTNGRILINGQDIRNFSFESLRKLLGIVLQDNILFSGTVIDNIKYGKPTATNEEVIEITKKLGIHNFIMNMENGYDTPVMERGSRLSAGQKQLIAFARALLVDPPILILDEATSAIDPYSEIVVKRALDKLLKNRTSITIAHRLSTVLNSDRILVMDEGEIVESGSHAELIKNNGLYKHLFDMQFTKIKN
ncbi:MAG: ABC transporter transmembrane domain-containing protein [Candidatus Hodarchaeota archaeon]